MKETSLWLIWKENIIIILDLSIKKKDIKY